MVGIIIHGVDLYEILYAFHHLWFDNGHDGLC